MSDNNNNTLLIVSLNKKAVNFLRDTLDAVFKGKVLIKTYYFMKNNSQELAKLIDEKPRLIMATGISSLAKIKGYYPDDKIIFGARDVSEPEYFDKLFLIPHGKNVLVVNETRDGALETIQALTNLGITHLFYVPYWDGCDISIKAFDTAITPGMMYLCPESIPNKIDIGMRKLSLNTFIRILEIFDLDTSYIDVYMNNQKLLLINTYKKLNQEYLRAEKLRNSLQTILNEIDDAIISVNASNLITEFNASAEKLFGLSKSSIIYKHISTAFNKIPEVSADDDLTDINSIVTINGSQVYVNYIPLNNALDGNTNDVGMFRLRETMDIQKKEEHVRKLLYKKNCGYVAKHTFKDLISENSQMDALIRDARFLSGNSSTILITGESGTGKEMFAQSIHNASERSENPFVAVNFAALPENLIESELFGYEDGAFTGARKSGKKGLFEMAHTGTIFLDEIGDSSLWVQTRLLRVLEEKEIMRLGDTKIIPIDVRVIAATNKDLKKLVEEGKFRTDLYYRINVFQLHIPPLRQRRESIPLLIDMLLKKQSINKIFSDEALRYISSYNWEGNIRELKNTIEYAVLMSKSDVITLQDLPYDIRVFSSEKNSRSTCIARPADIIYHNLLSDFSPAALRAVLEILELNKNSVKKIGRNSMLPVLAAQNIHLTESSLRTMFKHLESYGFIQSGRTKQGTTLSSEGEKFLAELNMEQISQSQKENPTF